MWERGGKGEMYGENNMETYITICKIESQETQIGVLYQLRGVGWEEMGGRFKREGINIYL